MNWTKAQENVIDSSDQSLLVTAAAGSGKTAVLVQRIISKITAENDPWDIDELLVVTFTKAAAKEMKERIYDALNKKLTENPSDHRIRSMRDRVFSADIRTIDSFCKNVVSEYFSQIDLDPDFRFMDSGETELLKQEVLETMIREEYEKGDEKFLGLSDMLSNKGDDSALSGIILNLYSKAQAYSWVSKYYDALRASVTDSDQDSIVETSWFKKLIDLIHKFADDTIPVAEQLKREISAENHDKVFDKLITNLDKDINFFRNISDSSSYNDLYSLSSTFKFEGVGKREILKKATDDDKSKADAWKTRRDQYRNYFEKRIKVFFLSKPLSDIVEEENQKAPFVREIIDLAEEFDHKFLAEKRDRKSYEFSDIEHFALEILTDPDGNITDAAKNYRRKYREVMVDEYQDTNELNERILSAVSRDSSNYFMVGDVKQSIYGFRNADPGIILRKSSEYQKDEKAPFRRIDLDQNFRSREYVIDTVNDIFRRIMIPELGGVAYDKDAELKTGATYYPALPDGQDNSTHTVVLLRDDSELKEQISDDKMELEATWAAQEIKKLFSSGFKVYDGKDSMRPVRYQDIAVILRSTKVNAAKILEIFNAYGIPAENAAATGYFSAPEVAATMNFLRLIDNPRQDVPMAGVLTSMYVGLSEEDIALIGTAHKDQRFHMAVLSEQADNSGRADLSADKRRRLDVFLTELSKLRGRKADTPVYELIAELYSDTGYDLLVSCLPGGERRRQNLLKLYDKAVAFSKTSFSGISAFISYIDRLKDYKTDEGEADVTHGNDAVQIMTIHKSKGLQFPVVFAMGLGKSFNKDKDKIETIKDRDITMPYIDVERHTRNDTVHFKTVRSINDDEGLGEELRVLYVALTRAEEKLYLVGTMNSKKLNTLIETGKNMKESAMSYTALKSSGSFFDFIIPALSKSGYHIDEPAASDFELAEEEIETDQKKLREELLGESSESVRRRALELAMNFTHPYSHRREVIPKQKYSVSEIKATALDEQIREGAMDVYKSMPSSKESRIPAFLSTIAGHDAGAGQNAKAVQKKASGAERGTAMHRFLEKLDFSKEPLGDTLDEQIAREIEKGFLTKEQEGMLDKRKLSTFLKSSLARRMQQAFKTGDLFREQAFVTGDSPELFFGDLSAKASDAPFSDQVIVQGIIDAFFVENDKIILIDYKTDFVKTEEELLVKYTKQLQLYQLALERGLELPVSEMYLYSFVLGKTVAVPLIKRESDH
ncbi:MAG: helicase-exonuclease AddAB subunit AddA [Lachnospiraceae bacterium]|uniref:DNA 3'-5' helicase n=1 Tax=Candidatus Weimeria bifida TaxID=2599074 RepID=A0A6N7IX34_9FIRM|nr:helicase-exonuclease AddAB subunit AddA [Candidatus Weimeria bifida]RRF97231.1 MAG: helicase-exonuclease AddAB subunit AddA [Lachnospiraceae bacterium]